MMVCAQKALIRDALVTKRQALVASYPRRWQHMVRKWQAPRNDDAVWLMYTANYLFNTTNVRWAVDPVLLNNRVPEAEILDVQQDLADLDFILLTHQHADHIDPRLWEQLSKLNCHWVIPDHMLEFVSRHILPAEYCVAIPGQVIHLSDLTLTPFAAPHYEVRVDGSLNHVDETGYLVKTTNGIYLLPGDIRTFEPAVLQPFTGVSTVFAHVFLGRSAALSEFPPLLEEFVQFYLSYHPQKIILTHLYEFGREPEDCWQTSHAEIAATHLQNADRSIEVAIPAWFEEIHL